MRNFDTAYGKPVKVALIDDGVDASHLYLRDNIKGGVTYCTSYRGKKNVTSSYYASSSGHGTLMATLICAVCPFASLYIAKLDDQGASEGAAFTAKSAANVRSFLLSPDRSLE
jgi:subtilisin family serine protease